MNNKMGKFSKKTIVDNLNDKIVDNKDVFNIVYKINEDIEYRVSESGIVTILEPQNHKIQIFFRKIGFKIPRYKKLEFDEYSSYVFLQINGVNTIENIGEILYDKYEDKANPLFERLLLFLNHIEVNCNYIKKI
ncbi:hypothetical protein [Peptostreptococcus canis]